MADIKKGVFMLSELNRFCGTTATKTSTSIAQSNSSRNKLTSKKLDGFLSRREKRTEEMTQKYINDKVVAIVAIPTLAKGGIIQGSEVDRVVFSSMVKAKFCVLC